MPDRPVAGRVVLVTGASHGTGVDIARAFAAAGARVAVHHRSDRGAAETVAAEIRGEGGVADGSRPTWRGRTMCAGSSPT
jgi:NAD(P)-dependent dehydrogenase (short-subunit alcohol dehydrogenase family)